MEYYFREVKSKLYSNDVRPFTFVKDSTLCLDIKEKKGPGWELLLLQSEVRVMYMYMCAYIYCMIILYAD